jgi:hypothetical protein
VIEAAAEGGSDLVEVAIGHRSYDFDLLDEPVVEVVGET